MNLVIVESPAKAKTIEKYLGKDFKVLASFGHVRDLPQKTLGVEVGKNYEPDYQILPKAKKTIAALREAAKKSSQTYLATDLDREGEAISWHLSQALGLKNHRRIVFNEITKSAVERAIQNPRDLDMKLVDAQQARRILDRLVGYKLSPLLWKKVKKGLSAGRVQSVAVRLVVEREKEIGAFKPVEFWILGAKLSKQDKKVIFSAQLLEIKGKSAGKFEVKNKQEADRLEKLFEKAAYTVLNVKHEDSIRRPAAPFTTSTLQMEASRKLGFSPKQTMVLAQHLYEEGHITYMRTDSTNLSAEALANIKTVIKKEYGDKYLAEGGRVYTTKAKHAQEAHEAIRPANFAAMKVTEDRRGQKLYDLIWRRTVATQMADAVYDVLSVKISGKGEEDFLLGAKGEVVKFEGFMKVYLEGKDEETEEGVSKIPELEAGETLNFVEPIKEQKFTEPPKRYSEATLVKKMESLGIGRPSTYAPTLETIQQRGYVLLEEKKFKPTEIGVIVSDLLVKHFDKVVDYQFTADMEDQLDEIAEGKHQWQTVIDEFYKPFAQNLKEKGKEIEKREVMPVEETGEKCPECGEPLVIRHGRFGKFIACTGYPKCKYSKPLETAEEQKNEVVATTEGGVESIAEAEEEKCEKCGGKMSLKEGRFGKFLACENYPKCKNTKTIVGKTGLKCPECEKGDIIERRTKRGKKFWGCSRYPECKYASWENPNQKQNTE